ncbi:unnamed protein product, partial [Schistosoma turkestanicum]
EDSFNLEPNIVFTQCLIETCKEYLTAIDIRTNTTTTTSLPSFISPKAIIRTNLSRIAREISQLVVAMENGEYDFDGIKQPLVRL